MKIFIKRSQSFPSFHTVHNDLELEEIELDHSAAQGQASAFYSTPSGGGRPLQQQLPPRPPPQEPPCPPAAPPPPAPNTNNGGNGKGKGKGRRKVRTTAPTAPATTTEAPRRDPPSIIPGPAPS
jgi:hypothetical protein